MKITVRSICNTYVEASVDEIETGTMNALEAMELAMHLLDVAAELLAQADEAGLVLA